MLDRLAFFRSFCLGSALCVGAAFPAWAQSEAVEGTDRNAAPDAELNPEPAPQSEIVVSREREITCPATPKSRDDPDEMVLEGRDIIEVRIAGRKVRLEVDPGLTGPVILNTDLLERLNLSGAQDLTYDYGAFQLPAGTAFRSIDFGCGRKRSSRFAWTGLPASTEADGVIGVYDLPFDRVTFKLGEQNGAERVEQFELKRVGGRSYPRLGTEVSVAGREMFAIFSLAIGPNLVSAPTANFLATHQEGAFADDRIRPVTMEFNLTRPTREMRIAYPLEVAGLALRSFAVRIEDYGRANRVGEMAEDDPRFQPGNIVVSRRRGRGRPDIVTRIGREQFAHCSRLTFDLKAKMGYLACSNVAEGD